MLLSFATTVIAAIVTYLSATDDNPDETAASGAKVRQCCTAASAAEKQCRLTISSLSVSLPARMYIIIMLEIIIVFSFLPLLQVLRLHIEAAHCSPNGHNVAQLCH